MVLKNRLEKDGTLRPLLAQFVPLVLNTDTEEWQTWSSRYEAEGESIPMVFVVRADGEKLFGKSGAFEGLALNELLKECLTRAGKTWSDAELKKLVHDLEKARQAQVVGDLAAAVALLVRHADSGSHAEPARQVDELLGQFDSEARARMAKADRELEDPEKEFEAALVLAEINRQFKQLPSIMQAMKQLTSRHLKDADRKRLFRQAGLIDRAQAHEAKHEVSLARAAYRGVLKQYPDTAAARLSQERLDELAHAIDAPEGGADAFGVKNGGREEAAAARSAASKPKAKAVLTSADRRKLASDLKTAQTLKRTSPEKARSYATRIIETAPDSPEAEEARKLLAELK